MSEKKDFLDTPIGNVVAAIVWGLGRVLSFLFFSVICPVFYYLLNGPKMITRLLFSRKKASGDCVDEA